MLAALTNLLMSVVAKTISKTYTESMRFRNRTKTREIFDQWGLQLKKLKTSSRETTTGLTNRVLGTFSTENCFQVSRWESITQVERRKCGLFQIEVKGGFHLSCKNWNRLICFFERAPLKKLKTNDISPLLTTSCKHTKRKLVKFLCFMKSLFLKHAFQCWWNCLLLPRSLRS